MNEKSRIFGNNIYENEKKHIRNRRPSPAVLGMLAHEDRDSDSDPRTRSNHHHCGCSSRSAPELQHDRGHTQGKDCDDDHKRRCRQ